MKALGTGLLVTVSLVGGMVAGAYLVMSQPCARKLYRNGKRAAKQMLNL